MFYSDKEIGSVVHGIPSLSVQVMVYLPEIGGDDNWTSLGSFVVILAVFAYEII